MAGIGVAQLFRAAPARRRSRTFAFMRALFLRCFRSAFFFFLYNCNLAFLRWAASHDKRMLPARMHLYCAVSNTARGDGGHSPPYNMSSARCSTRWRGRMPT